MSGSTAQTAQLVLASASPRRRELLRSRGIDFVVIASDIPETVQPNELPATFVERMAREKAHAVAANLKTRAWVLGSDTVVVVDDDILGKPRDADDACGMLRRLSGRGHDVMTGVALIAPDRSTQSTFHVVTRVDMKRLSSEDIARYVESGEPMDKAGAYAIQGGAARFIARVAGSYSNVVGLPLDEVCAVLELHALVRSVPAESGVE
jgi:septum formation protein